MRFSQAYDLMHEGFFARMKSWRNPFMWYFLVIIGDEKTLRFTDGKDEHGFVLKFDHYEINAEDWEASQSCRR